MFKFALAAGVCAEWLFGPASHTLPALASAGLRTLMTTLAVWLGLQLVRLLWRAVLTLDPNG